MVTYIGSIPIYDYSLGVRVHPPLYISRVKGRYPLPENNVVDLVYNGRVCGGIGEKKKPSPLRYKNTN